MSQIAQELGLRPEHFNKEDSTTALLVYIAGLLGVMIVNMDEKKKASPFLRFHMTQSIGLIVVMVVVSFITCGMGGLIYLPLALVYGMKAQRGEVFEIPVITRFMMDRGYFDGVKEALALPPPPAPM